MDPRLADAMLAAGIINAEQADRLRAELARIESEDWGSLPGDLKAAAASRPRADV